MGLLLRYLLRARGREIGILRHNELGMVCDSSVLRNILTIAGIAGARFIGFGGPKCSGCFG